MKQLIILATLTITIFSSCFQKLYDNSTKTDQFKKSHSSIVSEMTADEVYSLLGAPMNKQFQDSQETWQYCASSLDANQYFTVSFENDLVYGISNYSKKRTNNNGCIKCEQCFKEIKFRRTRKLNSTVGRSSTTENTDIDRSRKSTKTPKNYSNIDGEWVEQSADEVNAKMEKKRNKSKKNSNQKTLPSEWRDTFNTSEQNFLDKIKQTELVTVIAQFQAGSKTPMVIDSIDINSLMERINSSPKDSYLLVGHTNSQGAKIPNIKLATERAAETIKVLIDLFNLDIEKLSYGGAGEEFPLYDNATKEGRMKNSRVEIRKFLTTPAK